MLRRAKCPERPGRPWNTGAVPRPRVRGLRIKPDRGTVPCCAAQYGIPHILSILSKLLLRASHILPNARSPEADAGTWCATWRPRWESRDEANRGSAPSCAMQNRELAPISARSRSAADPPVDPRGDRRGVSFLIRFDGQDLRERQVHFPEVERRNGPRVTDPSRVAPGQSPEVLLEVLIRAPRALATDRPGEEAVSHADDRRAGGEPSEVASAKPVPVRWLILHGPDLPVREVRHDQGLRRRGDHHPDSSPRQFLDQRLDRTVPIHVSQHRPLRQRPRDHQKCSGQARPPPRERQNAHRQ